VVAGGVVVAVVDVDVLVDEVADGAARWTECVV
jgi:hypothetical protein